MYNPTRLHEAIYYRRLIDLIRCSSHGTYHATSPHHAGLESVKRRTEKFIDSGGRGQFLDLVEGAPYAGFHAYAKARRCRVHVKPIVFDGSIWNVSKLFEMQDEIG